MCLAVTRGKPLSATSPRANIRFPLYGASACASARLPPIALIDCKFHLTGRILHGIRHSDRRMGMLSWALIFFLVAMLAAVLGFTGIAAAAAGIAKILFFLFVILFLVTLLGHVARRP